jgi:thiamine-phosphate pyrophosphorylase
MTPSKYSPWIDFNLYLITDRHQLGDRDLLAVVEQALRGGVRAVQLREKDLSSRELYELAFELRKLTTRHDAKLLINDRADIALAVDADGVHLGGQSMPIYRARKVLGERKIIGVSCHNQISAITAQEKGADFITFGPVYYTHSKAAYGEPVGLDRLGEVADLLQIPVFALGGISSGNAREVLGRGVFGLAMIGAVLRAADPRGAVEALVDILPPLDSLDD